VTMMTTTRDTDVNYCCCCGYCLTSWLIQ